jgi:hypothetical protein
VPDVFQLEYCPGCDKPIGHTGKVGCVAMSIDVETGHMQATYGLCSLCSAKVTPDRDGRRFIKQVSVRVEIAILLARKANEASNLVA